MVKRVQTVKKELISATAEYRWRKETGHLLLLSKNGDKRAAICYCRVQTVINEQKLSIA